MNLKGTNESEAKIKANIEANSQKAKKAFLGFAFMSFADDQPVRFNFREVNKRGIVIAKVRKLMSSFRDMSIRNWLDPMAIVCPAKYVNREKLTKEFIDTNEGPRLEWTAEAQGQWIQCLGGQHRREAMRLRALGLDADANMTEKRLKKLINAKRDEQEKQEGVEELKNKLENINAVGADAMVWLVRVYDQGESASTAFRADVRAYNALLTSRADRYHRGRPGGQDLPVDERRDGAVRGHRGREAAVAALRHPDGAPGIRAEDVGAYGHRQCKLGESHRQAEHVRAGVEEGDIFPLYVGADVGVPVRHPAAQLRRRRQHDPRQRSAHPLSAAEERHQQDRGEAAAHHRRRGKCDVIRFARVCDDT